VLLCLLRVPAKDQVTGELGSEEVAILDLKSSVYYDGRRKPLSDLPYQGLPGAAVLKSPLTLEKASS